MGVRGMWRGSARLGLMGRDGDLVVVVVEVLLWLEMFT